MKLREINSEEKCILTLFLVLYLSSRKKIFHFQTQIKIRLNIFFKIKGFFYKVKQKNRSVVIFKVEQV